jgi:hypothetical protein
MVKVCKNSSQLQWEKWLQNGIKNFLNDLKNDYSWIVLIVKHMFWHCSLLIKYLTISRHDDWDIILDKMKHLMVSHYVKENVQSFNVTFWIKMKVQKNYLHYNKHYFNLNRTQKWLLFSTIFIIMWS